MVLIREVFRTGCEILNPIMRRHGFVLIEESTGTGSGGDFAGGRFVRGSRSLELHLRHSLGLVIYRVGSVALSHESYMRELLGRGGGNKYLGFSYDPLGGFRRLRFNLEHHCLDFLRGSAEEFEKCVEKAQRREKLPGFKRLHAK